MPPQVSYCQSSASHKTLLLSPNSRLKQILRQKYRQNRMKFTKKKLIPLLVFILFGASIFRFLNISMIRSTINSPIHHLDCSSSSSSVCAQNIQDQDPSESNRPTDKEMQFLLEFFRSTVPCNLLVFGHEYKYSSLASLNHGGTTLFIEDILQKTTTIKIAINNNNTRVRRITYNTLASNAYQLLREARENPDCRPSLSSDDDLAKCQLVLTNLPREVYGTVWDMVVVDGPSGARPDSPGRMGSIYTAGVLARRGNTSHVIVHDVDRTVEKWYSWEYLCEENLVASKGRFWHFRIPGATNNTTTFCTT
ncbi:hypothetical protein ABFS82_09G066900 [Erythranthe guttata]|uniref:Uncharacterized protein n=1 Tax=Erythranthe guttata TaxID=4155 RepID=A0A022Q350_ERYGU|nr:PREDICTED: glucuronoxylan 4-O-methyltransferase 1 [Erythranthe guttata]EYU23087.1 hypothetical protein MIMGU_mgv1a010610mg [Erythranthe guttata]|eukprot:XP_012854490.1 PREDICTED: glucuronoxylan 4-O-methyltransferase 1 [Erythranthe guttata]